MSHLQQASAVIFVTVLFDRFFAENGGLEALTPLFSDSQAACRHYGAECVISMSCEGRPAG